MISLASKYVIGEGIMEHESENMGWREVLMEFASHIKGLWMLG